MGKFDGFSKVKLSRPKRSMFDLSHEKKLSGRMGKLMPIFCAEVIPNDTFKVKSEVMIRFAPMLAPIYHRVNCFVHYFFVPNRLLWKDWEKFITNGRLGTETPPVPPYFQVGDVLSLGQNLLDVGSLADYLGFQPVPDSAESSWANQRVAMMPFAAYTKIFYDYYRDRNYTDDLAASVMPMASGVVGLNGFLDLRTRAWQHDYFTSALPWTQRGSDVGLPIEVSYLDNAVVRYADGTAGGTLQVGGTVTSPPGNIAAGSPRSGSGTSGTIENIEDLGVTINELRRATRLQEWLERNALAGSRYNESIMAHFARKTSDGRLQRAEYLGGGRVAVQIGEVMTTAYSEDGSSTVVPPANPTGKGLTYGYSNSFKRNFEEHGFVMGIMSVMPVSGYMQGMHRMFNARRTFLDYPWPSFANLGEQEVYTYELYMDENTFPTGVNEPELFGYQSRYADWKYIHSSVHGVFRTSLDFWHLDRKFDEAPVLGNDFVKFEDELQDRIFAVSEVDVLWCYIHNNVRAVRSLPYFGTPML